MIIIIIVIIAGNWGWFKPKYNESSVSNNSFQQFQGVRQLNKQYNSIKSKYYKDYNRIYSRKKNFGFEIFQTLTSETSLLK